MMMKKTTSALAVAALLGTGAASAATVQINDDMSLDVSGRLYYTYGQSDDGTGDNTRSFFDGSRFAVGTTNDLGNGLSAFSHLRVNVDAFEETSAISTDRGFVGVDGEFGTITVGKYGKVYDSLLSTMDAFDNYGPTLASSDTSQRQIRYSVDASDTITIHGGVGLGNEGGAAAASSASTGTSDEENSFEAGVSIDLGLATINAAYDQAKLIGTGDEENYGISASFDISGIGVTLVHHNDGANVNDDGSNLTQNSQDITGLKVSGSAGSVSYVVGVNSVDPEVGDSRTETNAVVRYSLAPNMYVSTEYQLADLANDKSDGYGMAVYYGF